MEKVPQNDFWSTFSMFVKYPIQNFFVLFFYIFFYFSCIEEYLKNINILA